MKIKNFFNAFEDLEKFDSICKVEYKWKTEVDENGNNFLKDFGKYPKNNIQLTEEERSFFTEDLIDFTTLQLDTKITPKDRFTIIEVIKVNGEWKNNALVVDKLNNKAILYSDGIETIENIPEIAATIMLNKISVTSGEEITHREDVFMYDEKLYSRSKVKQVFDRLKRDVIVSSDNFIIVSSDNFIITTI